MDAFLVILISLVLPFLYWLAYGRFAGVKRFGLPHPTIVPFTGHYGGFKSTEWQLHVFLQNLCKRYGGAFGLHHAGSDVVVLSDPSLAKQVTMKHFDSFKNRKFFIDLPWPCHGMITMLPEDGKWKYVRSLLSSVLTPTKLKGMAPHVIDACNTFTQLLQEKADTESKVDVVSLSQGYVMETLMAVTFSLPSKNQTDFNNTLVKLTENFTRPPQWTHVIASLPFGHKLLKYFPSAYKNQLQPFIDTALGVVGKRKAEGKSYEDLLQALLDVQAAGADSKGNVLTDEDILAQGVVVLTAVQKATSFSLACALQLLATHPKVQAKMQAEIDALKNEEGFPTWEHFTSKLKYMENVINETLRLYPSAFMLMRECTKSCTIDNIHFNRGDGVMIPTYTIQRDPKHWKNPDTFEPERFEKKPESFTFLPFGEGYRMCVGSKLAMVEMKALLTSIFSTYTLHTEKEVKIASDVTVQAMMSVTSPVMASVLSR